MSNMQEITSGEFRWLARVESYSCSVLSPKKETKFRGMKSFIAYQLTPSVRSHVCLSVSLFFVDNIFSDFVDAVALKNLEL